MVEVESWQFSYKTQVGWLKIQGNQYFLTSAEFVFDQPPEDFGQGLLRDKAWQQVDSYMGGAGTGFDLPVMTKGSAFQQKVWEVLESIPAGETRTYGEIARTVGSSPRAIGGACKKNPIAVIVPCHRVVAANGFGGYAGCTQGSNMQVKLWLLDHEG